MARKPSITNTLFWMARRSADLRAASKGPASYARREVRKVAYRKVNGGLSSILRAILGK